MSANLKMATPLFSRAKDFAVRVIAGETILVPIRSGVADLDSIFLLNETGSVVWEMVEGVSSPDELVDAVVERFDVSREDASRDVTEYLSKLEQAGLIRRGRKTGLRERRTGLLQGLQLPFPSEGQRSPGPGERDSRDHAHRCPLNCQHCLNNLPMG